MKIVVTGGAGFIGSNMLKFLKEKGHYVRAVGRSFNRPERAPLYKYADQVVALDLRDMKSCLLALEGMDYVIHLASDMGGVGYFHANDYTPYINNMTMDMNILQACHLLKIKRLYYASSACVYPIHLQMTEGKAPMLSEDLLLHPADCDQMYGYEKLMMTKLCERAPFDARVGIQHTIFGPYQETQGERMKFPTAIATKVLEASKSKTPIIEIWGNGKQIRSFLYIDDALEKIYRVLMDKEYHGPVNIGSEEANSVMEVAEICCRIIGWEPLDFVYTDDKPSGVLARNCSNKKFYAYYGHDDYQLSTREGFERLIEWLQTK